MDIVPEQENLASAVIPAAIGRKHIVILPSIRVEPERRHIGPGIIDDGSGLHEHRIREHIHPVIERERPYLGIVSTCAAFDYLPLGVLHRTAVEENRHTVLRVVVQMLGTQHIPVLVLELHQCTPELSQVPVNVISQPVSRQHRLVLKNLHIADSVDFIGTHIPERRITDEISIIVQKPRRARHFSVIDAVLLDKLHGLRAQKTNERVLLTAIFLCRQTCQCRENRNDRYEKLTEIH